jgi:uncharacterized protein (TIGR03437 family)
MENRGATDEQPKLGGKMRRHFAGSVAFFTFTAIGYSQPVIKSPGIVNAASYAQGSLARGAFFALFGQNLATGTKTAPAPYPTTLSGAVVNITPVSGGTAVPAYLYFASAGQINGILPSNVPEGDANVTVTVNGGTPSAPFQFTVVHSQFGIFTADFSGAGQGILQNYVSSPPTYSTNGLANAVYGGQTAVLWGTGVGPLTSGDDNHPNSENFASSVQILVGGQVVQPSYAGRSGYPGEDQINFHIPADAVLSDSCYIPISVKIGNNVSNTATIAKATGKRTCDSPLGLSPSIQASLDSGKKVSVGLFLLTSTTLQATVQGQSINTRTQAINGSFSQYTSGGLYSLLSTSHLVPQSPPGTCTVIALKVTNNPNDPAGGAKGTLMPPLFALPKDLDAGANLTLTGPGQIAQVPYINPGYDKTLSTRIQGLPGQPPDFLSAGIWALAGTGGTDVGSFQAQITLPTPFALSSPPSAITHNQNLVLNWTGGGTASTDYVIIAGASSAPDSTDSTLEDVAFFACTAQASALTFTVPANITGQLPVTTGVTDAGGFLYLNAVSGSGSSTFTAPLTAGGNIDAGLLLYNDATLLLLPVM